MLSKLLLKMEEPMRSYVTASLLVITLVILNLFSYTKLRVLLMIISITWKSPFESVGRSIWVFFGMRNFFDVGDLCAIDGVEMILAKRNPLTTMFLKQDNEKVYYSNAVLGTKGISNYTKSVNVIVSVEFSIPSSTPMEHLKEKIAEYLENNPQHWAREHKYKVQDTGINRKLALNAYRNTAFREIGEMKMRRTELVLAVKSILEELQIDYVLHTQ